MDTVSHSTRFCECGWTAKRLYHSGDPSILWMRKMLSRDICSLRRAAELSCGVAISEGVPGRSTLDGTSTVSVTDFVAMLSS
jgi:hypothetical protein